MNAAGFIALLLLGVACDSQAVFAPIRTPDWPDEPSRDAATVAATVDGRPAVPSGVTPDARGRVASRFAHSANRCADCHAAAERQWEVSGHAGASTPIYLAMRASGDGDGDDDGCDRCHAPLIAAGEPADSQAAKEGVTCLACHRIESVEIQPTAATVGFNLDDNTMYGPLCDARKHYFHKMGCSPVHETSRLCAGCHHLLLPVASGPDLPVFTEYQEWQASPYRARGVECQDCHMPHTARHAAVGAPIRERVHDHGMDGAGELRSGAITLSVKVSSEDGTLKVKCVVENVKVGHHAPTGLPGRQLVLRLVVLSDELREENRAERVYSRVLVDDAGHEVPFFAARRVQTDTRLAAGEKRTETFRLTASAGGRLIAELLWRPLSPTLATGLLLSDLADEILLQADVPFTRPGEDGLHGGLPRRVVAQPVK